MDLETAGRLHGDRLAPDRQTWSLRAERRAAGRPRAQSVQRELREREWPLFASLGKMAVPFGLTDTVNPLGIIRLTSQFPLAADPINDYITSQETG